MAGSAETDVGTSLGLAFAAVALVAAAYMVAAPTQLRTAWGFAAAMIAGAIAVAAFHLR